MRRTKAEIMEGVDCKESKIVGNNTVEYIRPDGVRVIRLHRTDIITFPKRGGVILNSGGWKTVTTKARMNEHQPECMITQEKGLWYITTSLDPHHDRNSRVPFFDGIKIKDGTVINPRNSAHRKEQSLLRQIKSYCNTVKKLDVLPVPSAGDCWYCSMHTKDNTTLGDAFEDTSHLLGHLKEKYIHGSLIFNALENAGYREPGFIFQMDHRDSIVRAISRYFKSKLSMVC
jgi:hypothetical protein